MADNTLTETALQAALARFQDPETGRSITTLGQVHSCQLDGAKVSITLGLTSWSAPLWEAVRAELENHLKGQFPAAVTVAVAEHQRPAEKMGTVGLAAKSVLAVGSGKGGVGKSSIAVFLAAGLARAGCKVGLLDANVYGPSIPHLLGTAQRPRVSDGRIEPVEVAGMKLMSIGLLVPAGEAVIWRGPMLHGALSQFLRDTAWGELDYLIVDMPPGTGDVALSLAQLLPQAGAVVVCTPQDVALLDAVKAIAMFRTVNLSLAGMVENMSFFVCPHCGAGRHLRRRRGEAAGRRVGSPLPRRSPLAEGAARHGRRGTPGRRPRFSAGQALSGGHLPGVGRRPGRPAAGQSPAADAAGAGIVRPYHGPAAPPSARNRT